MYITYGGYPMYISEGGGYPVYIREGGTRCTPGRGYPVYIREGVPNGVISWPIWEIPVICDR